jgi:predicted metal-dependent hydrolase
MKIDSSQNVIEFGSRNISYRLHRVNRKNLRIIISPELIVDIFAPDIASDEQIHAAIKKKALWILKTFDKVEGYHPLPMPKRYLSGETLVYLGRQYRLKVETGSNQSPKLIGRFLWVWVEDRSDINVIKNSVEAWYKKRAHELLGRYMDNCYRIASRHGAQEPSLIVRLMHRRWGSCSPSGRIILNLNLVKVPKHCIEYVIMHELCHLENHNHSKAFYSTLTRCMPDWRCRKETLDKFRLF